VKLRLDYVNIKKNSRREFFFILKSFATDLFLLEWREWYWNLPGTLSLHGSSGLYGEMRAGPISYNKKTA